MYRIMQQVIGILIFLMLVPGAFVLIIINNLIKMTLKQ